MAYTIVEIINLGLRKLGSTRVQSISPPTTSIERHCLSYYHWRDSELIKHEWVFSREIAVLPLNLETTRETKKYRYSLPGDALRILREDGAEWEQWGHYLFSDYDSGLTLPYIQRKAEASFDPLFAEVLACRVAKECVEYATQSNTKAASIDGWYMQAVRDAAKVNAVILEDRNISDQDTSWITDRFL